MNKSYNREVHTTFYSQNAADIISAALKKIFQGYTHHGSTMSRMTAKRAEITNHPNGEVLVAWPIDFSMRNAVSHIRRGNDMQARQWLAWQIKDVIHYELGDKHNDYKHKFWKRNNTMKSEYLSDAAGHNITIQEAYCIYDILLNRKNIDKHFPAKMLEDFRGVENDPFKTEMEIQRRDGIKLLTEEYTKKLEAVNINSYYSDIRKKMDEEINEVRKRYAIESKKLTDELTAERDTKIKEFNDQFAVLAVI